MTFSEIPPSANPARSGFTQWSASEAAGQEETTAHDDVQQAEAGGAAVVAETQAGHAHVAPEPEVAEPEVAAAEVAEPEVAVEATVPQTEPSDTAGASADPVTARIAEQLTALDTLADLPLAEHAQTYQHLHAELQDALADIDGP